MKTTIFFDLGNVLLFFDHQKMYQQIARLCGVDCAFLTPKIQKYIDAYERGAIDSWHIHRDLCQLTGAHLEFAELMDAMSDIFQVNQEMIPLISQLKKNGVALFLLSNTCEAHFNFARARYPFLQLFDGYVLSYQVQSRKPEAKIFNTALSMAQCSHADSFYTDDIPEYIAAAKHLGIDAELFVNHTLLTEQLSTRGLL